MRDRVGKAFYGLHVAAQLGLTAIGCLLSFAACYMLVTIVAATMWEILK